MKKNFNLKNIKNQLTKIWKLANDGTNIVTLNDYTNFYNALYQMHVFGFITFDEWVKITEHDTKLFNGEI